MRFAPPLGTDRESAWADALAEALAEEGLRVVERGASGSVEVAIEVSVATGLGATGAGTAFRVAQAKASVGILRAGARAEGRPSVAAASEDPDVVVARSLESLLPRVVAALTW